MKFSTREDVDAPIDHVFGKLVDFDAHEKMVLDRNGKIKRLDDGPCPAVGNSWDVSVKFRGKPRNLSATLTKLEENKSMAALTKTDGLEATMDVSLVPLSKTKTRMLVAIDLKPKTLSVRLVVQSMKLAKSSLTKRYKDRISNYATGIENSYKNG